MFTKFIKRTTRTLHNVGDFTVFCGQTFVLTIKPPYRVGLIVEYLYTFGIASINIIALASFANGLIFTLQLATELFRFNAPTLAGNVIAQTMSRELAPVFTAIMLIAKNGSAMTAEIGTMQITEQVNALQTMSINPIKYLVVPRLIACIIMFPVLAAFANLVGMLGASLVLFQLLDIETGFTLELMFAQLTPESILTGIGKAFFMGISTALICCYGGLKSERGSTGVGKATTKAVVISCVAVLLLDFLIGKILIDLGIK